jgi:hypothetical protein
MRSTVQADVDAGVEGVKTSKPVDNAVANRSVAGEEVAAFWKMAAASFTMLSILCLRLGLVLSWPDHSLPNAFFR